MTNLNANIILASNSPRRKELLTQAGIEFKVRTKDIEEIYPKDLETKEIAEFLARLKCTSVYEDSDASEVIIAADTVVIHSNDILGKPKDKLEAVNFLKKLSGKRHLVMTGVCIMNHEMCRSFSISTEVEFMELAEHQIEHYVEEFLPMDKAGAYAIQEWIGLIGIKGINGCYYNVVGLPVSELLKELEEFKDCR